jgi:hypothetical protein
MSQKNKLIPIAVLFLAALFLSGCGPKDNAAKIETNPEPPKTEKRPVEESNIIDKENLPAPTGKISDTLNAINSEVDNEKNAATEADQEAQSAVNDKAEADDFGATYDENEL